MSALILGPLLRYADSSSATVWVQTDGPCRVEIAGHTADTWAIEGHHFALVVVDGLTPGADLPYEVRLDGALAWPPPDSPFPPSTIRALDAEGALRLAFGSCRMTLPHAPPYTLRSDEDAAGHGIDALRAFALRAAREGGGPALPDMLLLLGDQIYADQPSPALREELERRPRPPDAPEGELDGFDEYALSYRHAWEEPAIRWLLSTVPTTMVFDDHEIHAEWRISDGWMREMTAEPWFDRHVRCGLMAYWVFQHLGNLAPRELRDSTLFEAVRSGPDGGAALAAAMDDAGHQRGHSRWSYARDIGRARLVVVDSRAGRDVTPGRRRIVGDEEWAWIREQAAVPASHLLLASSVPVLLAPGLHHLQAWDEAVADGAWGRPLRRAGEKIRRLAVLDHWASFDESFRRMMALVDDAAHGRLGPAPASVVLLSGDVHHCYLAEVGFRPGRGARAPVWQAVCSAFRKELEPRERRAIAFGHSRTAERLARRLSRGAGVPPLPVDWRVVERPDYANQVATLTLRGEDAHLRVEAVVDGTHERPLLREAFARELTCAPRR